LKDFRKLVNETINKLALPDSICDSTTVEDFIKGLEPTYMSGMAAVVGGVVGQDVLNALGGREVPIKNWLIFDGKTCTAAIFKADNRRRADLQFNGRL
jgi:hypothetical protein